jgi:DNA-binding IclR family transcriptional regulator
VSDADDVERAALLSGMPGVTIEEACTRFGATRSAVQRARKALGRAGLQPAPEDLVVAALSHNGAVAEGELPADLSGVASFVDYVNHDGCDAAAVRRMLDALVERGVLAVDGGRWTLRRPWPQLRRDGA